MSNKKPETSGNPDAELQRLMAMEADLRHRYDDEIEWLRKIASVSCSTEEQQRIVGNIDDLRKKLVRLEAKIWRLKHGE